jgi:hypothetical protein
MFLAELRPHAFLCLPIMAVHSLRLPGAAARLFLACVLLFQHASAYSGSVYQLDAEYSGANFFQGFDFYTVTTLRTSQDA